MLQQHSVAQAQVADCLVVVRDCREPRRTRLVCVEEVVADDAVAIQADYTELRRTGCCHEEREVAADLGEVLRDNLEVASSFWLEEGLDQVDTMDGLEVVFTREEATMAGSGAMVGLLVADSAVEADSAGAVHTGSDCRHTDPDCSTGC